MRVAVLGSTGRTGTHVVQQALAQGHQVTAIARSAAATSTENDKLTSIPADVLDAQQLRHAVHGADAVISALGVGTSRAPTVLYSAGIKNTLDAMAANGIRKLAVISAVPAGSWTEQPALQRRIALPLLQRIFGATYDDMRRMEAILAGTADLDWVALRPPRLLDRKPKGDYRIDREPLPKGRSITFADLATALLDTLGRSDLLRQAVYVAN